ncbi:hypothetical protein LCGC14_3011540 [marine sediment metagenome]|uniref:Uncharacterized protein n=1 Tax=marine sediment metagenome TaxID=412755 RepID=A0A0F8WXY3_9ZZZZ
MWSVNLQHFLDASGSTATTPPEARELADHFGAIVAAVTLDFTGKLVEIDAVTCRNTKVANCNGKIVACLGDELTSVDWYCDKCDDSGLITGWEDTLWDCTEEALADEMPSESVHGSDFTGSG